jgi:hypothetical protein
MIRDWLRRKNGRLGHGERARTEVRYVVANIYGDVIDSEVLVSAGESGHSENLDRRVELLSHQGPADRVLFCQADYEMLEISGSLRNNKSLRDVTESLSSELKMLVLAIPPEGTIVIPPTYYFESTLCQELMRTHAQFIDHGFVKLLIDYPDLYDYLEVKRERYSKAAHFQRYETAYYGGTDHGVQDLNFQITGKRQSVGRGSLKLWNRIILDRAEAIGYSREKIDEFRKRVVETEGIAFLHENVAEHMDATGITNRDAKLLRVRETKSCNYLISYVGQGICVPEGSTLVSDLLIPSVSRQKYNLHAWSRVYEFAGLLNKIRSSTPAEIIRIKMNPDVAMILATIRQQFFEGKSSDLIIGNLIQNNLLDLLMTQFNRN